MTDFTLRVNGQAVDYFDRNDFPLRLQRKSVEVSDITKRGGDKTYTFKLPMTARNKRVFGNPFDLQSVDRFYTSETFRVDLTVGGFPILVNAQLYLTQFTETEISAYIVSSNVNFANALRGKSLRDIQSFADVVFDGVGTQQAINAAVDFSTPVYLHSEDFDIVFPLSFYLNPFLPNKWTFGRYINQTVYVSGAGGFNANGEIALPAGREILGLQSWRLGDNDHAGNCHLTFETSPPAVYVRNIVRKIFEDLGYSVEGGWIDDNETRKLVLLFTGDNPPAWNWNFMSRCLTSSDGSVTPDITQALFPVTVTDSVVYLLPQANLDPINVDEDRSFRFNSDRTTSSGAGFTRDPVYFVPADGAYTIRVRLAGDTVTAGTTQPPVLFILRRPEWTVDFYEQAIPQAAPFPVVINDFVLGAVELGPNPLTLITTPFDETVEVTVDLKAFDVISFGIAADSAGFGGTPGVDVQNVSIFETEIRCVSSTDDLQVAPNLPDVGQLEFIQELIKLFNLYIDVDEDNRIVYLDSFSKFYEDQNFAVDLSRRTNDKDAETGPNSQAKQYDFKWAADNDFLSQDRLVDYNQTVVNETALAKGTQTVEPKILAPTEFDDFFVVQATGTFASPVFEVLATLRLPFITTKEAYFDPQNNGTQSNADFGYKPRIVKLKERVDFSASGGFINQRYWDDTQAVGSRDVYVQVSEYLRCVFAEAETYPVTNPAVWSLSWNGRGGLYELGYEDFIRTLQSSDTLEIPAYLTAKDFLQLTLRKLVRIKNRVYRVLEIKSFNPLAPGVTTLVLQRFV